MRSRSRPALVLALALVPCAAAAEARELTFEERVRAQEAIERVYYAHQTGATRSFEEAVPRQVLEKKVSTYLRQSAALEQFWRTAVTPEMLQREAERMVRETRLPGRLRELYAALDDDAFLVQECLARPALVDRLARGFFAFDARLHASAREEAEGLRGDLARRGLEEFMTDSRRSEVELTMVDGENGRGPDRGPERRTMELSREEYGRWRSRAPDRVREIGPVQEEREAFVIRVVMEETASRSRIASFAVPKRDWEDWWGEVSPGLDADGVSAVARSTWRLPLEDLAARGVASAGGGASGVAGAGGAGAPCPPNDVWNNGSLDDLPDGRQNHTAVWTGSVMVVWGGQSPSLYTGGRYDPATDTWTPTTKVGAPQARVYHTALWTGSAMLVWGGANSAGVLNTGGRYDPVTDTWTPIAMTGAPTGRYIHTAVWTGSAMIIWGGSDGSPAGLNTGGRYDPVTDTWMPTATTGAPTARHLHTAVWTGGQMVVWGGSGGSLHFNTGGRYDLATNSWTPTTTTGAPVVRRGHAAVWTGSEMLVWGGLDGVTPFGLDSGGRYDPQADTWTPTSTTGAPTARTSQTAVWTGSRMVVWGGSSSGVFAVNTGGRYDPVTDTWTPTATAVAPTARDGHSAVWTGGLMIVWGGSGSNTGGRYDPITDSWTPTATSVAPAARFSHTAVWTGSVMVVWGGYTSSPPGFNSGSRYDPATDTWTPTRTIGAPSARYGHTAVWTGSRMVVWGGEAGITTFNTGGRYDPVTDTWTPTATAGAPAARSFHTAVWTGSRMIVWGGYDDDYLRTGGRYNPAADSWTSTATAGAPSGRLSHTAVWTGGQMLVWGGSDGSLYFNTGGRYDLATNSWTPTTTTGAPVVRRDHTAVWTGSEMLVWGGSNGVSPFYLDSGGRYDPVSDTWAPTATAGAPGARSDHTALWTGTLMIVWGGYKEPFYLDTGGWYDPAADAWGSTAAVGSPSGRSRHTAIWTGREMIVWGGRGAVALRTGGRYGVDSSPDADGDAWSVCGGDCDDADPVVHPGASESCNALDDNCDSTVDDFVTACGLGGCSASGFCSAGIDSCVPGASAPEICDGRDNDCDGIPDNVPAPVGSPLLMVELTDTEVLSWTTVSGANAYDLLRGNLSILLMTGGDYSAAVESCEANDLSASTYPMAGSPAVGQGFFYLVRGENCGGPATYDSGASSQVGSRDAEIEASPSSCP
ncbi:MAG TPA: kelch repeat-containing protein [Candidatus Cryosericum sp.]|nr:kelch repeat-containing protein [Candidatus Cryosericum sp.]